MAPVAAPEWATRYVGLHYKPGGRDRRGVDCWGICALVWEEQFGAALPAYVGPIWNTGKSDIAGIGAAARQHAEACFTPVEEGTEREGDGILIRMRGAPLHVGLVVAPGLMLHVEEGADTCIERYRSVMWKRRILGFYRYAGALDARPS